MEKINLQVKTIQMAVDNISWEAIEPQTVRIAEKDVYSFLRNYIYLYNDLANEFTEQIMEIRYTTNDNINGNYVPCNNETLSIYFDMMRELKKKNYVVTVKTKEGIEYIISKESNLDDAEFIGEEALKKDDNLCYNIYTTLEE